MQRNKFLMIRDFLIKNSRIAFPVLLTAAVAVTVVIALGASGNRKVEEIVPTPAVDEVGEGSETGPEEEVIENVPLVLNEDPGIQTLIADYYNAQATGDVELLQSLCDVISDKDLLLYQETSRYISSYPVLEIYTKPGYAEGETIAFVYFRMVFMNHDEEFPGYQTFYICTREDGSRYIMRSEVSEAVNNYSRQVSEQDDVIEFQNRVIAEYDEFNAQHPDMANYPEEVTSHVRVTVGEILSAQQTDDGTQGDDTGTEGGNQDGQDAQPAAAGPKYASATTTVNVRSSDSEQADKLGKVSEGTRLEVLEERVNGWTKVKYESKEGFIKSEFLRVEESAAGQQSIGSVTATTNVNVRASASQNSEKLGTLNGGEKANLLAIEGEWCKIDFHGSVGYVKSEFVDR